MLEKYKKGQRREGFPGKLCLSQDSVEGKFGKEVIKEIVRVSGKSMNKARNERKTGVYLNNCKMLE